MFSRLRVSLCCPEDQIPGLAIVNGWGRATPENRVEALGSGWIEIAPEAASGGGRLGLSRKGLQKETYAAYRTLSSRNHNI
jgi:hypothetical protein